MAHQNAFGFELSDVVKRQTLRKRFRPYWQVLEYGRAVGYQIYPSGQSYWVARIRLTDESYRQERLAMTEDNPDYSEGLSFDAACEAAWRWFRSCPFTHLASDARQIGSREHLSACPIGEVYTVGHALTEWIEWKRLAGARSHVLTLVININYHIVPRLFSLPATELTPTRVRLFAQDVLETPLRAGHISPPCRRSIDQMTEEQLRRRKKTVNTMIGIMKMALVMAWENGKIDSDRPWRCLRRLPVVDRPRVLHLSRPECFKLLEHCGPDLRDLVLAALYTGCRIAELLRMDASHVGRDGQGVFITPVKSYRPRVVLLPDEGLDFFQRLARGKKSNELLLLRSDGRQWFTNYRHEFKNAVRAAELPEAFCFHGLRHTYASQLIQCGTPLIVISEQLGHCNVDTVSRTYGHLAPDIRLAEVRKRFATLRPSQSGGSEISQI